MIPTRTGPKLLIELFICIMMSLLLTLPNSGEADDSTEVMNRYVAMAIQGDLSGAPSLFVEAELGSRSPGAALRDSFIDRFASEQTGRTGDLLDGVIAAYQEYWKEALLKPSDRRESERQLDLKLGNLLHKPEAETTGDSAQPSALNQALTDEGLYNFVSHDPPLRDLLIWRSQESRSYSVQLTDQQLDLTVYFLDDFQLLGWKEYASLGMTSTTGWVEDGTLYCIAWAYDRDSENFEVSYLKHEARHLLDLERYPYMKSTELEYRSKLTELAYANRSLERILEDFSDKSAQNAGSPHAMANWRVIRDIYWGLNKEEMPQGFDDWNQMKVDKVNEVARGLLELNTREHEKKLLR